MESQVEVVKRFFEAFARKDGEAMARSYADGARFHDPVFSSLEGPAVGAMWRMLCDKARDLEVGLLEVDGTDDKVVAHWEARYLYGREGRQVRNRVRSEFSVEDGLIVAQRDRFSLWRWAAQALGTKGLLLGWTPMVQRGIRQEADKGLQLYRRRKRL
ncbi:MAG: nuclear transport factor 2 family protein [Myxococcota bacterium]